MEIHITQNKYNKRLVTILLWMSMYETKVWTSGCGYLARWPFAQQAPQLEFPTYSVPGY